ncbi:DNA polymerase III subunit chi [Pseudomonas sp. RIT-PI-S]|uniref:DNA polymerase III subunit chi n=1 Tax=Pseudomonas sp. RIT-PI-S TaxID=3035295 RepID=UPI0021DADB45|nr:DNA polymerase III subunit chi [Pseudomonas sp. RIT-PI-S]
MTQVDFYVLPSPLPSARLDFACKLAEKAWRLGHQVHVHCADAEQRQDLDARLWAFKGESFVPHAQAEELGLAPVTLGLAEPAGGNGDLLINLTLAVPTFVARFARVAEIVIADPPVRNQARENFRFYREQGYPLQDHRLTRI